MPSKPSSRRIERRLTTLFPSTALEDHAEAVGVVERDGKFQVPAMVWALVFGSFEATEGPEGSYAVFVTNRDDVSSDDAMGLTDRYSQRWDIENEYKSIKRFLPSIASTDFRMRCFAFMFSTLLYNVWRIVDFMMKILVYEKYDDYGPEEGRTRPWPVITANGCVDTIANVLDPPY